MQIPTGLYANSSVSVSVTVSGNVNAPLVHGKLYFSVTGSWHTV